MKSKNDRAWKTKGERVSKCLKGLSHEIRLGILLALRSGELNVTSLSDFTECPQPTLSQHVAMMRDRGILTSRREGTQVFYSVANPKIYRLLDLVEELFCSKG